MIPSSASKPPATEIPSVVSDADDVDYQPQPATPSDWSGLASSLGLEVEQEPEIAEPEISESEEASTQRRGFDRH